MERLRATRADITALGSGTSKGSSQHEFDAPACWVALIGLADPLSSARSCRRILEAALYSGIPKRLDSLVPADGNLGIIESLIRGSAPVPLLLDLREHRARWERPDSMPSVLVTLAQTFEARQFSETSRKLDGDSAAIFQPWLFAAELVHALLEMGEASNESDRAATTRIDEWTPQLDSFFASQSYRGLRRRAARRGGRTWAKRFGGDPPPLLTVTIPSALENPGFRAFCEEWLHAQGRSCISSNAIETPDLSALINIASHLETSGSGGRDGDSWSLTELKRFQADLQRGNFGDFDD